MNEVAKARKLRAVIMQAASSLSDEVAIGAVELFPRWSGNGVSYVVGDRVSYGDTLYKVIQAHTSQTDWTPDKAAALYTEVSDPAIEWPEWEQPAGAHDAYSKGDKVSYDNAHWISDVDNNVWQPGVYGWTKQ